MYVLFFVMQNFHVGGGSKLSPSSFSVAHVPPLEKHDQQMGVEQSTPLDWKSSPHPSSLASNSEKDVNLEFEKGDNPPNFNNGGLSIQ
jgi:hypothetical protein